MIPVIFDCDPGIDDAIALMLAYSGAGRNLDIKAVTTVGGNQTAENTLRNALSLLSFLGVDAKVAKGADGPLMRPLVTAAEVHGESGLEGATLPEPTLTPLKTNAVDTMTDVLNEIGEKVTLIATGPLTNVAELLLVHPETAKKMERIVIMGGACFGGNQSPAAEYNIYVDPEAAKIVFNSGVPIVMCGLDVTTKAIVYPDEIEKIKSIGNKVSGVMGGFMDFYYEFHKKLGINGIYMHDPSAAAYVIAPTLFTTKMCHVDIETQGEFTRGCTVVDYDGIFGKPKNAEVVFGVDRDRFVKMLYDAIESFD